MNPHLNDNEEIFSGVTLAYDHVICVELDWFKGVGHR